jgi:predicted MPP superfamily phosphohydrolase
MDVMAIIVGDIHGNVEKVKTFLAYKPEAEHVALGDYMDSIMEPVGRQIETLQLLMSSNVVLLWGNHDLHYLTKQLFQFAGYNSDHAQEFQEILEANVSRFYPAYVADGWLCTHAGVHRILAKDRTVQDLERLFCEEWQKYLQDRSRGYRFKSIFTFDYMCEGELAPDSIKQVFGHDELSDAAFINPKCVSIACSDSGAVWIFDTETNEIKDILIC